MRLLKIKPSERSETTQMKKAIVFLAVALAIPTSVAFAKGPHGPRHGGPGQNVQYVLRGTLSAYTAYDSSTSTSGSITIAVKHANYHGRLLKNQSLTLALDGTSKVKFLRKSSLADGTATAKGAIEFRAPRKVTGDLVTTLPGLAKHIHVVVLKNLTS